jgi:hypothetical protein
VHERVLAHVLGGLQHLAVAVVVAHHGTLGVVLQKSRRQMLVSEAQPKNALVDPPPPHTHTKKAEMIYSYSATKMPHSLSIVCCNNSTHAQFCNPFRYIFTISSFVNRTYVELKCLRTTRHCTAQNVTRPKRCCKIKTLSRDQNVVARQQNRFCYKQGCVTDQIQRKKKSKFWHDNPPNYFIL